MYAFAAGKRKTSKRLIPERACLLTDDHMKWSEKASRAGLTAAQIAEKLGVSEATFWRTRKDYRAVLAEKVKRAMLVSNANYVSTVLGVKPKDIPRLVAQAAERPLPRRLEKRLEGWEL
jgi:transcriptional regulator with XRE-family HTH domain